MSTDPYDDILDQAKQLSPEAQNKLVGELLQHVACKNGGKRHAITDLKGLGKEIWKDVDPDEYVAKERDAWDGYSQC